MTSLPHHLKTALVVGRFQPLHLGHVYLLHQALSAADQLVIAIGSSNIHNSDNPLSYEQREQMLQKVLEHESLQGRVKKIVALPDYPDDAEWVRQLETRVGAFDEVVGNNDWTNRVLATAGYGVRTLPDLNREQYQGTFIRQAIRSGEPWQERVPRYLVPIISSQRDCFHSE